MNSPNRQLTRNCHVLPKSYLRNFQDPEREHFLYEYSKQSGEVCQRPIKWASVIDLYYVMTDKDGTLDDSLEALTFPPVEGWGAQGTKPPLQQGRLSNSKR